MGEQRPGLVREGHGPAGSRRGSGLVKAEAAWVPDSKPTGLRGELSAAATEVAPSSGRLCSQLPQEEALLW